MNTTNHPAEPTRPGQGRRPDQRQAGIGHGGQMAQHLREAGVIDPPQSRAGYEGNEDGGAIQDPLRSKVRAPRPEDHSGLMTLAG